MWLARLQFVMVSLRFTALLGMLLLHCATSLKTIEEEMALYKYLKRALVTDTNIYVLQKRFYPFDGVADDVMQIFICQDEFTVNTITAAMNDSQDPAFAYNQACDCFVRQYSLYHKCEPSDSSNPCMGDYDLFDLSALYSSSFYVRDFLDDIATFDATFFTILVYFASDPNLHGSNFIYKSYDGSDHYYRTISLNLDYLPTNPSNVELSNTLSSLLTWVSLNY